MYNVTGKAEISKQLTEKDDRLPEIKDHRYGQLLKKETGNPSGKSVCQTK